MMDLKIITRHAPSNYGSLLQSIATIKILKGMGHQAQIIDYLRPDERGLQAVLTSLASKRSWNNNLLKKWFYVSVRRSTIQPNASPLFDAVPSVFIRFGLAEVRCGRVHNWK